MSVDHVHETIFQHQMIGIWWNFSIFLVLSSSFNRVLQKSRTQHDNTEPYTINVWSFVFILNDCYLALGVHGAYFPILIFSNTSAFLFNAATLLQSSPMHCQQSFLNLHGTASHPSCPKQKKKEFTSMFVLYQLAVIPDKTKLQLFKQSVHYPLCIMLSDYTCP